LAQLVGTAPRTIRYYIAQGLLPGPGAPRHTRQTSRAHLVRLRLIRLLSARHLPLAEIQALLRGLSLPDATSLLAAEEERSGDLLAAERRESPRDYIAALLDTARQRRGELTERPYKTEAYRPVARIRSVDGVQEQQSERLPPPAASQDAGSWSRWVLAPGVELHVRADAGTSQRALIRRLLHAAGVQDVDGSVDEPGSK
jgi:DNA-binding transcriptional MerR regulator